MSLSALVARWFGVELSGVTPSLGAGAVALQHYEEDDDYAREEDDAQDEESEADSFEAESRTDDEDDDHRYVENYDRLSQLFASSYEEEDAHRQEGEQSRLSLFELAPESRASS